MCTVMNETHFSSHVQSLKDPLPPGKLSKRPIRIKGIWIRHMHVWKHLQTHNDANGIDDRCFPIFVRSQSKSTLSRAKLQQITYLSQWEDAFVHLLNGWVHFCKHSNSLEGVHVFHKLLPSHTDSISDRETYCKWNKKHAFVFDMRIICSLTAIIALDLLEHEHQQLRQWIISLVLHYRHQFSVNMSMM